MTADSEITLKERWLGLCKSFRANGFDEWKMIRGNYQAEGRAYHNLGHIADCLLVLDLRAELAVDRDALEFAIWFHDVIYDARAHDNELKSSEVAARFLGATPISRKVVELILATRHGQTPVSTDGDQRLMVDIDLSILGRSRSVYEAYAAAIRAEYSWVPEKDYVVGRSKVLKGFLDRASIFSLAVFQDEYEARARRNMEWGLSQAA